MIIPEISEKELAELKGMCEEELKTPQLSHCPKIVLMSPKELLKLITAYEHKKAELETVEKENGKLKRISLIANDIDFNNTLTILEGLRGLSRTLEEGDFLLYLIKQIRNLQQALRELDNETI